MGTVAPASSSESPEPLAPEAMRLIGDAAALLKQQHYRELEDLPLARSCVAGMASAVDPLSAHLDAARMLELEGRVALAGVGLELDNKSGLVRVLAALDNSPAQAAGVRPGDLLLSIDGQAVTGRRLHDVVDLLRGKKGSQATLRLWREGETAARELVMVRDFIAAPSVKGERLPNGAAYVKIKQLTLDTLREIADVLTRLDKPDPFNGIVLDLRGNTGGLLHVAVGTAAAFLAQDSPIVSTRGRTKDSVMDLRARRLDFVRGAFGTNPLDQLPKHARSVPMVVLVDRTTASGAEIVAAALQDNGRAPVIGGRTAGVGGTIQTLLPLPNAKRDGFLKITTAIFVTPKGRTFATEGLMPDVLIEESPGSGDAALERALQLLAAR